jgi:hypothetical protein
MSRAPPKRTPCRCAAGEDVADDRFEVGVRTTRGDNAFGEEWLCLSDAVKPGDKLPTALAGSPSDMGAIASLCSAAAADMVGDVGFTGDSLSAAMWVRRAAGESTATGAEAADGASSDSRM